ncbi:sigma-54-dependent transcriptional regulator [Ferrimonas senticii]|uniref:sigma-54-dependent transcriptional regulator n=1 Tax=Ferrimonas senticii TaxID=394566 RepID=UPI0004169246|nr:sigma-54 dependent transcriptional regulator [Ferrimonas senticii]
MSNPTGSHHGATILVVEDDLGLREALVDTLMLAGFATAEASDGYEALLLLKRQRIDMVISDVQMDGMDGLTLLKSLRLKDSQLPFLLMTAHGSIDAAVAAMQAGASDYLAKPFAPQLLLDLIGRYLQPQLHQLPQPVVADPKSQQLLALAARVAATDASVMVLGPSGSGKEVLARYIHQQSPRKPQPFVALNCAAIPENMLEATLFGYEKGAFTGAVTACAGKFEQAEGGTILLDEITEMDLNLQAKLLRVLQEREVERLGSRKTIKLNVRVLATSNRDLAQAVADGKFREDLYYRLNVFPLTWPALWQRPLDIVPLAEHLLAKHALRCSQRLPQLAPCAQQRLLSHRWPGNVRELDNVMQRALILCQSDTLYGHELFIDGADFSFATDALLTPVATATTATTAAVAPVADAVTAISAAVGIVGAGALNQNLQHTEFSLIAEALRAHGGSRKAVSEQLALSPRTLRYKLAKMRDAGFEIPA